MGLAVQLGNLLFGLARKFVVTQILGHCRLAVQLGNLLCSGPDSGPLQASCSAWQLAVLGVQVYDVYSGARSPVVVK